MSLLGKKMGKQNIFKSVIFGTLRDLLNIIRGANVDGASNIITFSDTFGKEDLTFSRLYNYIKSQKHLIYNRDIPQALVYVSFVRILAFLQRESISQDKSTCLPIPIIWFKNVRATLI